MVPGALAWWSVSVVLAWWIVAGVLAGAHAAVTPPSVSQDAATPALAGDPPQAKPGVSQTASATSAGDQASAPGAAGAATDASPPAASQGTPPAVASAPAPELSPAVKDVLDYRPALPPVAETRHAVEQILALPEFVRGAQAPEPKETWWDRFVEWLNRQGGWVGLNGQPWMIQALAVLLVLLLLYTIARLAWEYAQRLDLRSAPDSPERRREPDAASLLDDARAALKRGDARLAVRLRFLALVKQLDLPGSALRTNHQVGNWLKLNRPGCAPGFLKLTLAYEDAWYGGQACSTGDYTYLDELAEQVAARAKVEAES